MMGNNSYIKFLMNNEIANRDKAIKEIKTFCTDNEIEEYASDFYGREDIEYAITSRINDVGWEEVATMLSDVESTDDEYLYIDCYGNFRNVTEEDIRRSAEIIVNKFKHLFNE